MADWLHPLLRFAHYALLLGLFGVAAFRAAGLRRLAAAAAVPQPRGILLAGAIAAPVVSAALMAVSIAEMMGQPVSTLDWAVFETMVASTSIGCPAIPFFWNGPGPERTSRCSTSSRRPSSPPSSSSPRAKLTVALTWR